MERSDAAADVMALGEATFSSGKVEVKLKGDVSGAALADVEATLQKLNGAVLALKATPEKVAALITKVAALITKVAAATAKVPVLASKVTASATVTASNPFGDASAKAKAQADLDGVKKTQDDVMKSVSGVQGKITGIPEIATKALAKASASFAGGS